MSWSNSEWQAKQAEFDRAASIKSGIVREAQRLAHSDDFRSASRRMKELSAEFKNAGFAGKDQNQHLWDSFSAARDTFYQRQNDYYERLNHQSQDNARRKENIIGELHRLLVPTDYRAAGQRVKELHDQWKSIGFAGRDDNLRLNDEYYSLRDQFYANSKAAWERRNVEMEMNKNNLLRLVQRAEGIADHPDPRNQSNDMRALIQEWRDQSGPVKKEDREELNRRFWSAKDRFYSRRDAQFAQGQQAWKRGEGPRSSVQMDPAWRPDNHYEEIKHLEQAIRDQEQAVRDADAYYDKVRSQGGRSWILPSKQNENLYKAKERQRIARERLDAMNKRLFTLRHRG